MVGNRIRTSSNSGDAYNGYSIAGAISQLHHVDNAIKTRLDKVETIDIDNVAKMNTITTMKQFIDDYIPFNRYCPFVITILDIDTDDFIYSGIWYIDSTGFCKEKLTIAGTCPDISNNNKYGTILFDKNYKVIIK